MNKRILVGVDMELPSPTQQALRVVSEFLEPPSPYLLLSRLDEQHRRWLVALWV